MRPMLGLAFFIAVCLLTGFLGSLATRTSVNSWYAELSKPSWTPPGWVFPPVWTTLYVLMAVSAWLVWRNTSAGNVRLAMTLFGVQLALNVAWSVLFFGMRWPGGAVVEIVVLWCIIVAMLLTFWRSSPLAAGLLVPYVVWVSFAAALNFTIWRMNN